MLERIRNKFPDGFSLDQGCTGFTFSNPAGSGAGSGFLVASGRSRISIGDGILEPEPDWKKWPIAGFPEPESGSPLLLIWAVL